jgi:hypothetical protein
MRGEKRIWQNWPPIYTILMVAPMAPQPLETCTFYRIPCELYNVQCTFYKMRLCDWDCTFDDVITCDVISFHSSTKAKNLVDSLADGWACSTHLYFMLHICNAWTAQPLLIITRRICILLGFIIGKVLPSQTQYWSFAFLVDRLLGHHCYCEVERQCSQARAGLVLIVWCKYYFMIGLLWYLPKLMMYLLPW